MFALYVLAACHGQGVGPAARGRKKSGAYHDGTLPACGEVFALYALAACHGQGGSAAVERLSAFERVAVWVLRGNEKAIRFYERFGFRFDGATAVIRLGTPNTERRMVLERV